MERERERAPLLRSSFEESFRGFQDATAPLVARINPLARHAFVRIRVEVCAPERALGRASRTC